MKTVEEAAAALDYRRRQFEDARSMYSSAGNPNPLAEAAIEHTRQMYVIAREEFADAVTFAAVATAPAAGNGIMADPIYLEGYRAGSRETFRSVANQLDRVGWHNSADWVRELSVKTSIL